jgi:hypothetical protein
MGIITRTLLSSLPQVAHLCLVIIVCMVLTAAVLTMAVGHRTSAAHVFPAALNELFNGLLGGAELTLEAVFPQGVQQPAVQAFAAGLIYYLRDFLFIMVLMQFFMATIGSVFVAVKSEAQEHLLKEAGAAGEGSIKLRGTIPHDLADHVWPEVRAAATCCVEAALSWCHRVAWSGRFRVFTRMSNAGGAEASLGQRGNTPALADSMIVPAAGRKDESSTMSSLQLLERCDVSACEGLSVIRDNVTGSQGNARGLAEPAVPAVVLPTLILQPGTKAEDVSWQVGPAGASKNDAKLPLDLPALQGLLLKQLLLRGGSAGTASNLRDPAGAAVQEDLAGLSAAQSWLQKRLRQQQKQQQAAVGGISGGSESLSAAASDAADRQDPGANTAQTSGEAEAVDQDEQQLFDLPPGWRSGAMSAIAHCGDVQAVAGVMVVAGVLMKKLGIPVTADAIADGRQLLSAMGLLISGEAGSSSGSWMEGAIGMAAGQGGDNDGGGQEDIGTELLLHAQIYGALWNAVAAMERWSLAVGRWSTKVIHETNHSLASNAETIKQQQQAGTLSTSTDIAEAETQYALVQSLPDLQTLLGGTSGLTQGYSVDNGELMQMALQYLQQQEEEQKQQSGLSRPQSGTSASGVGSSVASSSGVAIALSAMAAVPLVGRKGLPPLFGPVPTAGLPPLFTEECRHAVSSSSSLSPSAPLQSLVVKSEADLFSQSVLSPSLEDSGLNSIPDSSEESGLILATDTKAIETGDGELGSASEAAAWEGATDAAQGPGIESAGALRGTLATRFAQSQPGALGFFHGSLTTLSGGGGSSMGSSSGVASPEAVGVKSKHWAWESNSGS